MDKIGKALRRLTAKERKTIQDILNKLSSNQIQSLDVKKLKGRNDIFRIRKSDIRILYQVRQDGKIFILAIERRREKTYKDF